MARSPREVAAIRRDYNAGLDISVVAMRNGITNPANIYRYVVPARKKAKVDPDMAYALQCEGVPLKRIGGLYGVTKTGVHNALKRNRFGGRS